MKVGILHDTLTGESRADELDVLDQARLVADALCALGHESWTLPVSLNLASLADTLRSRSPDLVFNLAESLGGHGRLIHLIPALLEALDVPFTGCGSAAMLLTTNKVLAKELLRREGVLTPPWWKAGSVSDDALSFPSTWLVKPVWEDASVGIDDDALVRADGKAALDAAILGASPHVGEVFAEQYIEGREFNLSLLAGESGARVLPAAEIEFVDYPPGKPRIIGYQAKWQKGSFEYDGTPRRFDFPISDQALLEQLSVVALRCWALFQIRGYARVDFRVDDKQRPWVLEVNANPCLAPDAGFMAAAGRAGLNADCVVQCILADRWRPMSRGDQAIHAANQTSL